MNSRGVAWPRTPVTPVVIGVPDEGFTRSDVDGGYRGQADVDHGGFRRRVGWTETLHTDPPDHRTPDGVLRTVEKAHGARVEQARWRCLPGAHLVDYIDRGPEIVR